MPLVKTRGWIRPAGKGGGSAERWEHVDLTIAASNPSATAQEFYGDLEPITFSMPDLNSPTCPYISVAVTPISWSSSMYYSGPPISGLGCYAGGQLGLVVNTLGGPIDWNWGGGVYYKAIANTSQSERFLNYGYYGGRYNASFDSNETMYSSSTGFGQCPTQTWDPPYVPNGFKLWCKLARCTFACTVRVSMKWTPA